MDSQGLRYLAKVLLGTDAMQWLQADIEERARFLHKGMSDGFGFVGHYIGSSQMFGWEIYDAGSGVIGLRDANSSGVYLDYSKLIPRDTPLVAIDSNGRILEFKRNRNVQDTNGDDITIPNDGVWRTLVCRRVLRQTEPGTLTLTGGSTTVTGSGTRFTRYSDASDPERTILRIDAGDTTAGNEGAYPIATITDNNTLTLATAPPNDESGVPFRVQGQFFRGAAPADVDLHNNNDVEWELVTRTTTRPTDGSIIAYDVMRNGGTVSLIDRRRGSMWMPKQRPSGGYTLLPANLIYYNDAASSDFGNADDVRELRHSVNYLTNNASASTAIIGMSMAPCAAGSHLSGLASDQATGMMMATVYDNGATRNVQVSHYTVPEVSFALIGGWDHPDGGSAVTIATGTGIRDVAIIPVPAGSGFTHLAFIVTSAGAIRQYTTADNGATWVGPTTIWTPNSSHEVLRVDVEFTRMHRLVVVALMDTAATVRAIYSDDIGSTWNTNSDDGHDIGGTAGSDVAVCEDDWGNLWTVLVQGSSNGLRMFRGKLEGNPVPDPAEQSTGWTVGPEEQCDSVDVVPFPNGQIGIFTSGTSGTTTRTVHFLTVSRRQITSAQTVVLSANSPSGNYAVQVACGVMSDGQVMMGWSDKDDSGGVYDIDARTRLFAPVQMPRAHGWYGGQ